jgi:hypothetical protein
MWKALIAGTTILAIAMASQPSEMSSRHWMRRTRRCINADSPRRGLP